jgi:hypothetical protein
MNVDLWNDAYRGKPMYLEKNLSCCHMICHKYHVLALGSDLGQHSERPVTIHPRHHITLHLVMG